MKELSKTADFKSKCDDVDCSKSVINLLLRAQFIRGLSDSEIRERILQQSDISFEQALEIALAIEASKIESKEVYKGFYSNSVNKVTNTYDKGNSQRNKRKSRFQNNFKFPRSVNLKKKQINFKELGLDKICLSCGKSNHKSIHCRLKNKLKCDYCFKDRHTSKVCISRLIKQRYTSNSAVQYLDNAEQSSFEINQILDICLNRFENDDRIYINVQLNDKPVQFECDSGSRVSIMNIDEFKLLKLNVPILKTDILFRSYTGDIFKPVGFVKVNVNYKGNSCLEELYLVSLKKDAILGRNWIRKLKINLHDTDSSVVKQINAKNVKDSIDQILKTYSDVFEPKVGKIPNYTCSLKLRSDAKPVFLKPRPIPYALREKVDTELDKLSAEGIIEKVDYSEWGTPLVIIPKSDGSVRLCADYKVTVNNQLHDSRHPIPKIEDIFNRLHGGSYFCTLDIYKAYLHLVVDEESAKVQAISTHRGTYLAKRLFFGIKSAPNEFHAFIHQFVQDLDGVSAYFNDLIIQGKTIQECRDRLVNVLEKLRRYNLHLNLNKCKFFEKKVEYLGHIISSEGLSKSPEKVRAIQNAARPKNVDELKKFLGLIMYYSKFFRNASTVLGPLNKLLCKDVPFEWTADCEAAWIKAKSEIASDNVLIPFTPELPVVLATDASPFGLSGILSHRMPDGSERPIAFASRSLTAAEKNYSQLDKEATAVYWACKKFYDYIFGRKFTLIVDNKPIMSILHPEKKLPILAATRLLRYAYFLSNFDYKIEYRKSTDHVNVDYLSRNPLTLSNQEILAIDDEYLFQECVVRHVSTETVTASVIKREMSFDQELSQLKENIMNGKIRDPELTLQEGILFRGQRVIIPKTLQPEVLRELHSTHVGIVKMKALARNYCYWKNIDLDIENMVRNCKECCDVKKNPQKAPIHNWDIPSKNWQRIHIDYAGPFMGHFFLLIVDAKSKWPEIYAMKKAPDTTSTIYYLREIFSRQGLPDILVSDNASIFKSKEFVDFCNRNGIRQRLIAPGHPATNGQVERYCQTLKTKLKCMRFHPGTLQEKLCELLFRYRATPLSCGKTPAELMMGRNLKTKLDLLKPEKEGVLKNTAPQPAFHKFFRVGSRVQCRNYTNSILWKYGTVVERLGQVHYLIELDDGYVIKRHFNQLRECEVPVQRPENFVQIVPRKRSFVTFNSSLQPADIPIRSEKCGTEQGEGTLCKSESQEGDSQVTVSKSSSDFIKSKTSSDSVELRRSTRVRKPVQRLNYSSFK